MQYICNMKYELLVHIVFYNNLYNLYKSLLFHMHRQAEKRPNP